MIDAKCHFDQNAQDYIKELIISDPTLLKK